MPKYPFLIIFVPRQFTRITRFCQGTFIYLQSLGKAFASTAISMVREVVFGVGFALLLPVWFGLDGVLYSMPVSDILTFLICVIVIRFTYRTLNDGAAKNERR